MRLLGIRKEFLWGLLILNITAVPIIYFLNQKITRDYTQMEKDFSISYGKLSPFSLVDQSNQSVTLDKFKGRVWIANFIFTRCAGQCPLMSLKASDLQKKLPKDILIVSFSVDPDFDSPAKLLEYSKHYGAEAGRWHFLTGEKKSIDRILNDFHLNDSENPMLHSLNFALIDSSAVIRGLYDSTNESDMKKMAEDAQLLLEKNRK